jgi:hypothetical protein
LRGGWGRSSADSLAESVIATEQCEGEQQSDGDAASCGG